MKYIDADKLITEIEQLKETNKVSTVPTMKASEYVQGGIYGFDLAIEKIAAIIASHLQEQPEVDFEDIAYLLHNVKYMPGYWIKTNPNCAKIIRDFNKRLNTRKEE